MSFRLTVQAQSDLVEITETGVRLFGEAQAIRYYDDLFALFDLIAANPDFARERLEIRPPVRIHPFKAHLIYIVDDVGDVLILRIRHGRENWSDPLT